MSKVFWDTNVFIYLFEEPSGTGAAVVQLLRRMQERGDELVTSTLTLAELLVKPLRDGDGALASRYEKALKAPGIRLVSFDERAARHYADIRCDKSLRAPDALQLACAAVESCDLFVTNDLTLTKKNISGIQFITSLSGVPL